MIRTPFDNLLASGTETADVYEEPLVHVPLAGEFPEETTRRTVTNQLRKARDLASYGVPAYADKFGDPQAVTDEAGAPLTGFSKKTNTAFDSLGVPRSLIRQPGGKPPVLGDAYEGAEIKTDQKTGAQFKVKPGLPKWRVGTDETVVKRNEILARDKEVKQVADVLGRKLSIDEGAFVQGGHQQKAQKRALSDILKEDFQGQAKIADGTPFQDVRAQVAAFYDAALADKSASATEWFSSNYTEKAKANRDRLLARKAQALGHVDAMEQRGRLLEQQQEIIAPAKEQKRQLAEQRLELQLQAMEAQGLDTSHIRAQIQRSSEIRAQKEAQATQRATPVAAAQAQAPQRGGNFLTDTGVSLGIGINSVLKMAGDLYGLATGDMDNPASRLGKENIEWYEGKKSGALQKVEKERRAAMDALPEDDEAGRAWEWVKATFSSPRMITALLAEQAPNLVPALGAGKLAGTGAAKLLLKNAADDAAKVLALKTAGKIGVSTAVGTGAVMQGSDVGGDQYTELVALLHDMPPEQAAAIPEIADLLQRGATLDHAKLAFALTQARKTGALAGGVSIGSQFLPGAMILERAAVGGVGKNLAGNILVRAGKGFAGEAVQEMVEEGGGLAGKNILAQPVDPQRRIGKGMGETLAMAGATGGIFGGIFGAVGGVAGREEAASGTDGTAPSATPDDPSAPPPPPAAPSAGPTPLDDDDLAKLRAAVLDEDAVARLQLVSLGVPEDEVDAMTPEQVKQAFAAINPPAAPPAQDDTMPRGNFNEEAVAQLKALGHTDEQIAGMSAQDAMDAIAAAVPPAGAIPAADTLPPAAIPAPDIAPEPLSAAPVDLSGLESSIKGNSDAVLTGQPINENTKTQGVPAVPETPAPVRLPAEAKVEPSSQAEVEPPLITEQGPMPDAVAGKAPADEASAPAKAAPSTGKPVEQMTPEEPIRSLVQQHENPDVIGGKPGGSPGTAPPYEQVPTIPEQVHGATELRRADANRRGLPFEPDRSDRPASLSPDEWREAGQRGKQGDDEFTLEAQEQYREAQKKKREIEAQLTAIDPRLKDLRSLPISDQRIIESGARTKALKDVASRRSLIGALTQILPTNQTFQTAVRSKNPRIRELAKQWKEAAAEERLWSERTVSNHDEFVQRAIDNKEPVSAAAVEAYGIKLPDGWQKKGDLWHPPEAKTAPQAPAASRTVGTTDTSPPLERAMEMERDFGLDAADAHFFNVAIEAVRANPEKWSSMAEGVQKEAMRAAVAAKGSLSKTGDLALSKRIAAKYVEAKPAAQAPAPSTGKPVEADEPTQQQYDAMVATDRVKNLKRLKEERKDLIVQYGNQGEKHPLGRMLGGLNPAAVKLQSIRGQIAQLERLIGGTKPEKPVMTLISGTNAKREMGLLYNIKFGERTGKIGKSNLGKWYAVENGEIVTQDYRTAAEARDAWAKSAKPTPTPPPAPAPQAPAPGAGTAAPGAKEPAPAAPTRQSAKVSALIPKETQARLAKMGIMVREDADGHGMGVDIEGDALVMLVSPDAFMARLNQQPAGQRSAFLTTAREHEITHLAWLESIRREWLAKGKKAPDGTAETLLQAFQREARAVAAVMGEKTRAAVEAGYGEALSDENAAAEFIRQLDEMAKRGDITEGMLDRIKEIIARLRAVLKEWMDKKAVWPKEVQKAYEATGRVKAELEAMEQPAPAPVAAQTQGRAETVFTRDEIGVSKPSVSRRKRPEGTDGESVTEISAPSHVTNPDNWSRLGDINKLSATVEARLDFASGKVPEKTDSAWTAYGGRRTERNRPILARGVTYEQALEAAKDHVESANATPSSPAPAAATAAADTRSAAEMTPAERAQPAGQRKMANEAASVATVTVLNNKVRAKSPSEAWSNEQIQAATGKQKELDAIRDDLLPIYNRLYAKESPAPAPAEPQAKEPWQMTRAEYREKAAREFESLAKDKPGKDIDGGPVRDQKAQKAHVAQMLQSAKDTREGRNTTNDFMHNGLVAKAVEKGKPVPASVLADYPDLAAQPPSPSAQAEQPDAPLPPLLEVERRRGPLIAPYRATLERVEAKLADEDLDADAIERLERTRDKIEAKLLALESKAVPGAKRETAEERAAVSSPEPAPVAAPTQGRAVAIEGVEVSGAYDSLSDSELKAAVKDLDAKARARADERAKLQKSKSKSAPDKIAAIDVEAREIWKAGNGDALLAEHSRRERIATAEKSIAGTEKRMSDIEGYRAEVTDSTARAEFSGTAREIVYDALREKGFDPSDARDGALSIPKSHFDVREGEWKGTDEYTKQAEKAAESARRQYEEGKEFHAQQIAQNRGKIAAERPTPSSPAPAAATAEASVTEKAPDIGAKQIGDKLQERLDEYEMVYRERPEMLRALAEDAVQEEIKANNAWGDWYSKNLEKMEGVDAAEIASDAQKKASDEVLAEFQRRLDARQKAEQDAANERQRQWDEARIKREQEDADSKARQKSEADYAEASRILKQWGVNKNSVSEQLAALESDRDDATNKREKSSISGKEYWPEKSQKAAVHYQRQIDELRKKAEDYSKWTSIRDQKALDRVKLPAAPAPAEPQAKEPTFRLKQDGNVWAIVAKDDDAGGTTRIKTLGGIYTDEQMQNAQKMVDEMNARSGKALAPQAKEPSVSGPILRPDTIAEARERGAGEEQGATPLGFPPEQADEDRSTGISHAYTEGERAKRGMTERDKWSPFGDEAVLAEAKRRIAENPGVMDDLVNELTDAPREVDGVETMILMRATQIEEQRLDGAMNDKSDGGRAKMDTSLERLEKLYAIDEVIGSIQGHAFRLRQRQLAGDFSLARMLRVARAKGNGGEALSKEQVAEIKELHDKIAALEKKVAESGDGGDAMAMYQRVVEELTETMKRDKSTRAEYSAKLKAKETALLEEARNENLFPDTDEEEGSTAINLPPESANAKKASEKQMRVAIGIGRATIDEGHDTLDKFTDAMVKKLGKGFAPYAADIFKMASAIEEVTAPKPTKKPKPKTPAPAGESPTEEPGEDEKPTFDGEKPLTQRDAYELIKWHVAEGAGGGVDGQGDVVLAEAIRLATLDFQETHPDITEREVRDLFTQYGKPKFPNQEAVAKKLREINRIGKLISAVEDAQRGVEEAKAAQAAGQTDVDLTEPLHSGLQRDPATQAVREKEKARIAAMKELVAAAKAAGIELEHGPKTLKSSLDAAKSRMKNAIEDIRKEIATRVRQTKAAGIEYDIDAKALQKELAELRKQRDEIFGPTPKKPLTDAQRLAMALAAAKKSEESWNERLKNARLGQFSTPGIPTRAITSAELESVKARAAKARDAVKELEAADSAMQEAAKEKRLMERIAKLEEQIAAGVPEAAAPVVTADTEKVAALTAKADALRKKIADVRKARRPVPDAEERELKRIENEIARVTQGTPPPSPKARVDTEQQAFAREQLAALRAQLAEQRAGDPALLLAAAKKSVAARAEKLKERIRAGDFEPKKKKDIAEDKELHDARFELDKLKEQFNRGVFERMMARRTRKEKFFGAIFETLNVSRAMMTSGDLSAVFRQGAFIGLARPSAILRNIRPMLAAFADARNQHRIETEIRNRANSTDYKRAKLDFTLSGGASMHHQEEAHMSRRINNEIPAWLRKIPVAGGLIEGARRLTAASARAYSTFLNLMRADAFDVLTANLSKDGSAPTLEEMKAIANYINVATGRGYLPQKLQSAAVPMNALFFAPKNAISRFQLLAGQPFYGGTKKTRKLIAKEYARFAAGVAVVYVLASLMQGDDDEPMETDPRSSDFGKIRFGNTRLDPMAGLLQPAVFASRMVSGESKTISGKVKELSGDGVKYGGDTRTSITGRFLRSKLAPGVGMTLDLMDGKNVVGQPVTPGSAASQMVVPLAYRDIAAVMQENGATKGAVLSALAILGMGANTFEPNKPKSRGMNADAVAGNPRTTVPVPQLQPKSNRPVFQGF